MGEIKLDAHNYRIHDERNLKLIEKSLKECGFGRSIVIDADGEIIAGNATYKTAKALGIDFDIIKTDGTKGIAIQRTDLHTKDKKRKKLALVDNTSSDKLNLNFEEIKTDFSTDELPSLGVEDIPDLITVDQITEDEVPSDEQVETRVKKGDIWQLGEHRLMCGDSTVITDVEKLMNGEKADMVFTDPPYGVSMSRSLVSGKNNSIVNDDLRGKDFYDFLNTSISNCFYFSKENCPIYLWIGFRNFSIAESIIKKYREISNCIVWVKPSIGLGGKGYRYRHELCVFCGEIKNKSLSDVWEFGRDDSGLHPTMKPVELIANALKNSTKENDLVIDLFGGSGSTLIACEQLKRKCRMMELDEHYCDVILTRWENLTGKQAQRIE